jgi:hypothetical protein
MKFLLVSTVSVGWFQIVMDDAFLVRRFEGIDDLASDGQSLVNRKAVPVCKRRPVDQFHDERVDGLGFLETVDLCDVGVIHSREESRFTLESGQPIRIGRKLRRQNFDRDVAPELRIAGAIDFSHRTRAERATNLVRP